ncbi:MAG: helix-turn-helix domain-containing protein [Oscillospiraceae bacterium]|nr:helix-turn-helix domain-containing protein [Oscillospiraceae bacterium]
MRFDCTNLRLYRKKLGYTQEQTAERLGVSRQALAKWERGESVPDLENVIALADLYEVSVDSLVRSLKTFGEAPPEKKHMFGIITVNDKGQITLPKKCREVFGINPGDALLLLGDEDKGMALMKVSEFAEEES